MLARKCKKVQQNERKKCGMKCDRIFTLTFSVFLKENIWFHILQLAAAGDHCHIEIRSDIPEPTLEMTFSSHQKLGLSQSILFLLFPFFQS